MNVYHMPLFGPPPPPLRMSRHVLCRVLCTIGACRPEAGGILLGPIGSDEVTDFYFDKTANCTGATYAPDYPTLSRNMREDWVPSGIDMKGFVHSHPGGFDGLSFGDLVYVRRLLARNPDMRLFAAPIVIPEEFRLQPIVVCAANPDLPRRTRLELF